MKLLFGYSGGRDRVKPASQSTICSWAGGLQWRCLATHHAQLLGASAPDWSALDRDERAECVKCNPLREVYRFQGDKYEVYAKFFRAPRLAERIKWHFRGVPSQIEFDHLQIALLRGMPVAQPLAWSRGRRGGQPLAVLITDSLGATCALDELLWSDPPAEAELRAGAVRAAGRVVARLHCAGFEHGDLHPGNILVVAPTTPPAPTHPTTAPTPAEELQGFITDLQDVRIEQRSGHASADATRPWRMANVATLLAAIRTAPDAQLPRQFVSSYLQTVQPSRGWTANEQDQYLQRLMSLADRHDRRVARGRDRRALRNSRYGRKITLNHNWSARVYLECKYPWGHSPASHCRFTAETWRGVLADPLSLLAPGELLKQGGHTTVVAQRLMLDNTVLEVVAKHTRRREGWRGWLQAIRTSRALWQWFYAHALLTRGILTAWPLAAIEQQRYGLLQQSIYLCERIPHSHNLMKMLRDNEYLPAGRRQRTRLAQELGRMAAQLRRKGFRHRDCKASNILIQIRPEEPQAYRVYLIDLDGLRLRWIPVPLIPARLVGAVSWRHEALVRLGASVMECQSVGLRDRVAVFRAYLLALGLPEAHNRSLRRKLWQRLSREVMRKNSLSRGGEGVR